MGMYLGLGEYFSHVNPVAGTLALLLTLSVTKNRGKRGLCCLLFDLYHVFSYLHFLNYFNEFKPAELVSLDGFQEKYPVC